MTQRFAAPLILATRALSHFLFHSITRLSNVNTKQNKQKKIKEEKRQTNFKCP
jgi:hypothetical protein